MILLRSSSRCWRKLIAGRGASCSSPPGGRSATISGIVGLRRQFRRSRSRRRFRRERAGRYCANRLRRGRKNRLRVLFDINLVDLGLNLRLELIRGTRELIEGATYLTANLWELFGTKNQEGQKEKENHL